MNGTVPQPRPVVDAARSESRNQGIVASVVALAVVIPRLLAAFGIYEFTDAQLVSTLESINLFAAVVLAFMARETHNTALQVEAVVTPTASPMKTVVEAA